MTSDYIVSKIIEILHSDTTDSEAIEKIIKIVGEYDYGIKYKRSNYGIKYKCLNGNNIWFEPITDEVDGYVERTPEGAIVRILIDEDFCDNWSFKHEND